MTISIFYSLFTILFSGLPISQMRYYSRLTRYLTKILGSSKLKEFADDNSKFHENGGKFSYWEEKRNLLYTSIFFLFPQCFQKTCTADSLIVQASLKVLAISLARLSFGKAYQSLCSGETNDKHKHVSRLHVISDIRLKWRTASISRSSIQSVPPWSLRPIIHQSVSQSTNQYHEFK